MKSRPFPFAHIALGIVLSLLMLGFTGCETVDNSGVMAPPSQDDPGNPVARLHIGDTVTVSLTGLPDVLADHEETIKEDGSITLSDVGRVKAAGRTVGELQEAIHDLYVPQYYTHINVTVKTGDRVFYVRGEVHLPNRQIYVGQITVTKAITSAGDFTDFANPKKVILIRANGQRYKVNCDAVLNGEEPDPPVYPGDQIIVPRRAF